MQSLGKSASIVTGSEGLIGSALCERLNSRGVDVIGIDIRHPCKRFRKDVRDLLDSDFNDVRIDTIFHCAGYGELSQWARDPIGTLDICYSGTKSLLNIAKAHRAKFILMSSAYVSRVALDCSARLHQYIVGKAAAESIAMLYADQHELPVKILRLNNVYGPFGGDDGRVIPSFIRSALAGINPIVTEDTERNFCFIDDVIEQVIRISLDASPTRVYELHGEPIRIANLANLVEEVVQTSIGLREGVERIINAR